MNYIIRQGILWNKCGLKEKKRRIEGQCHTQTLHVWSSQGIMLRILSRAI